MLIDETRNRITAKYQADMQALKHAADEIAKHERAASVIGFHPVVSVAYGDVTVWLQPLTDENKRIAGQIVKEYNGQYAKIIAGRPAFLCVINGDDVFVVVE